MKKGTLNPKNLIQDSLISIRPIYGLLLIFLVPRLILNLLTLVISKNLLIIIHLLYFFSIGNITWGGIIFYVYQKLNGEEVTLIQSLQRAIEKFSEILLARIILFLFIPIFPHLFVVPYLYLIVVKNFPAASAFKPSWQLTRGYGWQILWNYLILLLIYYALSFLSSLISASIFGVSVWELNQNKFFITEPAFAFDRLLTIAIYFFVYTPFYCVYLNLIFVKISNLETRTLNSIAR